MTAVIGILNKSAVALAADSAVTISGSNGRKIFNTANKIFTLSKFHPVGIMIYSSASLMSTPWETIIKIYRQKLKDKSFPTVKEYQDDFIRFLKISNYFTTIETQKLYFKSLIQGEINEISKKAYENLPNDNKINQDDYLKIILQEIIRLLNQTQEEKELAEDFKSYSFDDFLSFSNEPVQEILTEIFSDYLNNDLLNAVQQYFYNYVRSDNFERGSTGLVFAGFGDDEIYPSLCSIEVGEIFDNRILVVL